MAPCVTPITASFTSRPAAKALMPRSPARTNTAGALMPVAIASLAKELLEIEASGDRARAESWFKKYGQMPDTLRTALKSAASVPVDVEPVYSFPVKVR